MRENVGFHLIAVFHKHVFRHDRVKCRHAVVAQKLQAFAEFSYSVDSFESIVAFELRGDADVFVIPLEILAVEALVGVYGSMVVESHERTEPIRVVEVPMREHSHVDASKVDAEHTRVSREVVAAAGVEQNRLGTTRDVKAQAELRRDFRTSRGVLAQHGDFHGTLLLVAHQRFQFTRARQAHALLDANHLTLKRDERINWKRAKTDEKTNRCRREEQP